AVALALVGRLDVLKSAVLTTAFPDATRRTQIPDLEAFVQQSMRLTGGASLVVVPLFFIGGALIVWLYGAAYAPATSALIPLLLRFRFGLNAQPASNFLYASDQ